MAEEELPKPGDLVGVRYRIESMLGQGGMGAVFAAVNQATGRAVAIKWMLPGAARSQESLARFLSEARATAKIEHPNVIQILDVGQDGACPFLVMERLRGRSLADRLEKGGRMSAAETVSVILAACRGVAEAHNEGILHRDLKPDNIFLCEGKDGSPRPPKVLDFGISKLYEEGGGGPSLTRTGMAMGTPQYMSPEQLSALPDMDGRLDVYAMGVVLYECLTGRPPYTADGLFELVQQIAAGNPTPIRVMSPDVPPDLEAIVMRAMTGNRDHRYPSMRELIAALEQVSQRLQSGAPAPHVPVTAGHSAPGTGPMSGGPWAGQGGYATPPSGGGYVTPAQGAFGPPSQQYGYPPSGSHAMAAGGFNPPAPSSSSKLPLLAGAGCVAALLLAVGIGAGAYVVGGDDDTPDIATNGSTGGPLSTGDILNTGNTGNTGTTGTSGSSRTPTMGLTFSGDCAPRFTSRVMVTASTDSLTVVSTGLAGIAGSITLMLPGITGTTNISSQQRIDTQTVINVMANRDIWTNLTMDSVAVANGRIPDPISGSITVTEYDPELARSDITFHNVTLQHLQNGGICTVNGRLQTFGATYGM